MKFVYVDESGKSNESPVAVMCGIALDSNRMRKTRDAWLEFILWLNKLGIRTSEMHTANFFAGKGVWFKLKADVRKTIISHVIQWINGRAHEFCVVAADKKIFSEKVKKESNPFKDIWFFMSTHLIFAFSKRYQGEKGVKGDFIAVFDHGCIGEEFNSYILSLEAGNLFLEYFGRSSGSIKLSDVPFSADSKSSSLIQISDFIAFFVRRKIELEYGIKEVYTGEKMDIDLFYKNISRNRLDNRFVYKKSKRSGFEELLYETAPDFIKK